MPRARRRSLHFDPARHAGELAPLLEAVARAPELDARSLDRLVKRHPKAGRSLFRKSEILAGFRALGGAGRFGASAEALEAKLRMRPVRTLSGVTPVTVLTKPYPCPGRCIFCPSDVRMPKSYLSNEPGAQRAEDNRFDPYLQTWSRLAAYRDIGHPVDKVELIVLGGTWSFYPEPYQRWFVKRCLDAMNDFGAGVDARAGAGAAPSRYAELLPPELDGRVLEAGARSYNRLVSEHLRGELAGEGASEQAGEGASEQAGEGASEQAGEGASEQADESASEQAGEGASEQAGEGASEQADELASELLHASETASWAELEAAQRRNDADASRARCVGLSLETRPDHVDAAEALRLRRLGATKVQLGIQSLSDRVLDANRRGHGVEATRRAMACLRRFGFKLQAHWMPNLAGSSPAADAADFARLFDDPDFRPDELKLYPCVLIPSAELAAWFERGDWRPYGDEELETLVSECLARAPRWCRVSRVIRDFSAADIAAGSTTANLRELAERRLVREGRAPVDVRAREIRGDAFDPQALVARETAYATGVSEERFLELTTPEDRLVAFLRLSLPRGQAPAEVADELAGAALVREVHVYGASLGLGRRGPEAQHRGLGRRLVERAAEIARAEGYARLAVISAIGTRAWYRSLGFSDGRLYQRTVLQNC